MGWGTRGVGLGLNQALCAKCNTLSCMYSKEVVLTAGQVDRDGKVEWLGVISGACIFSFGEDRRRFSAMITSLYKLQHRFLRMACFGEGWKREGGGWEGPRGTWLVGGKGLERLSWLSS